MISLLLALDLGGTWIKGAIAEKQGCRYGSLLRTSRKPNPLGKVKDAAGFAKAISDFSLELCQGEKPSALVISTAGELNPAGTRYICASPHLGIMGETSWIKIISREFDCPVKLINDAESFLIGCAQKGLVSLDRSVGALVIGTGLGFTVARNGLFWKPSQRLLHYGEIAIESDDYNHALGATRAMKENVFFDRAATERYGFTLARCAASAINLFHLDTLLLGGGMIDLARSKGVDLVNILNSHIPELLLPGYACPQVISVEGGNPTILEGALTVAAGEQAVHQTRLSGKSGRTSLTPMQVPSLAKEWDRIAQTIRNGGRVIFLGAGDSGRIRALEACATCRRHGLSKHRFVAVIRGGIAEAGFSIDEQAGEDISSIPDLALLAIDSADLAIGQAVDDMNYFVISGLTYAQTRGAKTMLIRDTESDLAVAPILFD